MTGPLVAAVFGEVLAEWADTGYCLPVARCELTAGHGLHDWPLPRRNYPAPPIWHCRGYGEQPWPHNSEAERVRALLQADVWSDRDPYGLLQRYLDALDGNDDAPRCSAREPQSDERAEITRE